MTSSGGNGRPGEDQDARDSSAPPESGQEQSSRRNTSGPIGTEVAAALRAQDERNSTGGARSDNATSNGTPPPPAPPSPSRGQASQSSNRPPAPQSSNNPPPAPQGSNGASSDSDSSGDQGKSGSADSTPAATSRRQNAQSAENQAPRGAAAARVATKARRTKQDNTPGNDENSTPNPWARPAEQDGSASEARAVNDQRTQQTQPSASNRQQQDSQQQASPVSEPTKQQGEQHQSAPIPPPSLVAKQRKDAAASGAAAPPLVSPATPAASGTAPSGQASSAPVDDTQASMDAIPAAESQKSKTVRPASTRRNGRTRKARLRLLRVDPWSVMKTSFLLSVALGITLFVAVAVLWSVLDAAGVFSSLDEIVTDMTASDTNSGIDINQYVELSRVLGFTTLIAVVDVVLLTALATLGAFLYNLSASLLGGLELTLAEDD